MDEDVGAGHQFLQHLARGRIPQIDDDAALAPVEVQEHPRHARAHRLAELARRVAARAFQLDDVGAEIGKQLGAIGPHQNRRQIQHTDPRQRPLRGTLRLTPVKALLCLHLRSSLCSSYGTRFRF